MRKFNSRKFLISLAAFLASIGGSISGIVTDNHTLTVVGTVCTVISAAIYAACEAYVDGKAVNTPKNEMTDEEVNNNIL